MSKTVVWVQSDQLSSQNPALKEYPDAPALFVFDEVSLQQEPLAFHRLFFIYESVCETFAARTAKSAIRRGVLCEEISDFAGIHHASHVVTTHTPGSHFQQSVTDLRAMGFVVTVLESPFLVPYDADRVPHRFSAWWREVADTAVNDQ